MATEGARPIEQVYDIFPRLRRQIQGIELYLHGVASGAIDPASSNIEQNPLFDPKARLLRQPMNSLGGKSAIQLIREQVALDREEERTQGYHPARPLSLPQRRWSGRSDTVVETSPTGARYINGTPIVAREEEIYNFDPEGITLLHLTNQGVINIPTIEAILRRFPHLKVLQMAPSEWTKVHSGHLRLLEEAEVKLQFERVRNNSYYDEEHITPEYVANKGRFEEMLVSEDMRDDVAFMEAEAILALEFAKLYYGGTRLSMQRIAQDTGVPHHYVQRKIGVINALAGCKTEQVIKREADLLLQKIRLMRQATGNVMSKDAYRASFAIEGKLPPKSLRLSMYKRWSKLQQIFQTSPELLEQFHTVDPRRYDVLTRVYGVNESGTTESLMRIAEGYGVTRESIRNWVNSALSMLGVLEEDE